MPDKPQKYGKLTVLCRVVKKQKGYSISDGLVWLRCECECGRKVTVRETALKCGDTKSCGCWNRSEENNARRSIAQIEKKSTEYIESKIEEMTRKIRMMRIVLKKRKKS